MMRCERLLGDSKLADGGLSVMYITDAVRANLNLRVCFGKVKSEAHADQLIAFARCSRETLPIEDRDLPSAALNQTVTFQLASSN